MGLDSVGAADLGLLSVGVRRGRNFGDGPRETLDLSAANNSRGIYVIICGNTMSSLDEGQEDSGRSRVPSYLYGSVFGGGGFVSFIKCDCDCQSSFIKCDCIRFD